MVLEALAAVGLAGNIVQFLDFSCKLFSAAASIQHSSAGSSEGLHDVETVTLELQRWCVKIPGLLKAPGQRQVLQRHKSLLKLAENCEIAATDLLAGVQSVKAKKPKSKWSTFKAALATIWKESQINDMERRLNSYRQQLILELVLLQRDDNEDIKGSLDNLERIGCRMGAEVTSQILDLGNEIRDALETLRRDLKDSRPKDSKIPRSQDHGGEDTTEPAPVAHMVHAANLADCSSKCSDIMTSLIVLDSLTFRQMRYRYDAVLEAHPKTFEWVFDSKFQSWLKSSDTMFWISGKPGSGKSTLMKKLIDNPKTPMALREWAGSHKLVVADYFFWVNGTEIQRSQEGLLRALLYNILRQAPNLIKDLVPSAWRLATDQGVRAIFMNRDQLSLDWSQRSLLEVFQRLSTVQDLAIKFCFFIDGLDEYYGDHEELIETIRHLEKAGIKLCVASRPWNVFEEAFGSDDARKIYMQHLNVADIQQYVYDKLTSRPSFQKIDQDSAVEIVEEIVKKSQGVFLWVRLVVRSLTEGLSNRDNTTILRERLRGFPSDLDQFFRHIFLSLEIVYRSRLSHMFQVALASCYRLSSIAYSFLDDVIENPDFALTMSTKATSMYELSQINDEVVLILNGRSKGLLEVLTDESSAVNRVDFLHRTVKDFLMTTDIQRMLADWQHPQFNPQLTICKITLAEAKFIASTPKSPWEPAFLGGYLRGALWNHIYSAHEYEIKSNMSPTAYLVGIEHVIIEHDTATSVFGSEPWDYFFSGKSFLGGAVRYDLCIFLAESINKKPLSSIEAHDCLRSALSEPRLWNRNLSDNIIDADGIPMILDIILWGTSNIMVDGKLLNCLVDQSLSLGPGGGLTLANRFITHSIVSSSILEDTCFKKGLEANDRSSLKMAYSRHWHGQDSKSIQRKDNDTTNGGHMASSNQNLHRSSIRKFFRRFW